MRNRQLSLAATCDSAIIDSILRDPARTTAVVLPRTPMSMLIITRLPAPLTLWRRGCCFAVTTGILDLDSELLDVKRIESSRNLRVDFLSVPSFNQ